MGYSKPVKEQLYLCYAILICINSIFGFECPVITKYPSLAGLPADHVHGVCSDSTSFVCLIIGKRVFYTLIGWFQFRIVSIKYFFQC